MAMSHGIVANLCLCHMSNVRNGNVACHYLFPTLSHVPKPDVACGFQEKAIRNSKVAWQCCLFCAHVTCRKC